MADPGPPPHVGPRTPRRYLLLATGVAVVLLAVARIAGGAPVPGTAPARRPPLSSGDRLVVLKTTSIDAGDVVVFDGTRLLGPSESAADGPAAPLARLVGADPATAYVKRVIGVPGDRVVCCTDEGEILRNGAAVEEPYATGPSDGVEFDVTVPEDRYWVMGDNRGDSTDSRSALGRPGGGMLRADDLVGEVVWRYWPASRWGRLARETTRSAPPRTSARPVSPIGNTAEKIPLPSLSKESAP